MHLNIFGIYSSLASSIPSFHWCFFSFSWSHVPVYLFYFFPQRGSCGIYLFILLFSPFWTLILAFIFTWSPAFISSVLGLFSSWIANFIHIQLFVCLFVFCSNASIQAMDLCPAITCMVWWGEFLPSLFLKYPGFFFDPRLSSFQYVLKFISFYLLWLTNMANTLSTLRYIGDCFVAQ